MQVPVARLSFPRTANVTTQSLVDTSFKRSLHTTQAGHSRPCFARSLGGVGSPSRLEKYRPVPACTFTKSRNQRQQSRRTFATTTDNTFHESKYAAVVVGGGPAGITVLGNLLERDVKPVLWIDGEFEAGRVNRSYREVPR